MGKQLLVFDCDENVFTSIQRGELDNETLASLLVCIEARDKKIQEPIKKLPSVFGLNDTTPPTFTMLSANNKINFRQFSFITILRPYLIQLLASIYKDNKYDIAIFSMGTESYVKACCYLIQQQVRDYLGDHNIQLFKAIKTRKDSRYNPSINMDYKDLSSFESYKPENVLLVDNLAFNFSMHTKQGVPMVAYNLEFIKNRECDMSQNSNCDIGLVRLHEYINMLDPSVPLANQNIFGVFA